MYILGVNGWEERSHDASACLIKDGRLIAMAEEERFTRKRYAFDSLPINAARFCLDEAKISLDNIDIVTIGWDLYKLYKLRNINFTFKQEEIIEKIFPKKYFHYTKYPKVEMVLHHLAHAASAFYASSFEKAAILVIDGQGEYSSTTLAYGEKNQIKIISEFPIEDSLGYLYESVSKFVGYGPFDVGKIMGLVAYGKPIYKLNNIKLTTNGYKIKLPIKAKLGITGIDEQPQIHDAWDQYIQEKLKLSPNVFTFSFDKKKNFIKEIPNFIEKYKNLVASVQTEIEKVILHLCWLLKKQTKCDNLILAGGVALNCITNGKIASSKIFKNLYILPPTNDAGVSLGAAFYVYKKNYPNKNIKKIESADWGPSYDNLLIKEILTSFNIKHQYLEDIGGITAKLIGNGKTIGWFQGRMEIGPRALGNRSILADPRFKRNHGIVNFIKGREIWRPLCPSILNGHENNYFDNAFPTPFMLIAFNVKEKKQSEIPAVVHFDHTTRPQSVFKKESPKFYELISNFYKETGVPLLLNTSFNSWGEPIVCNPIDAIKTFFSTPLDYLVLENYLIQK